MPNISIIVALSATNRGIGKKNGLLWHLPSDLKKFKELTTGHPVVMGRKTWESLPNKFRPLPHRTNIVVTRDDSYNAPGGFVVQSLEEAFKIAKESEGSEEIFIIGGAQIYEQALPLTDRLYLRIVHSEVEADSFFPEYESEFTKVIVEESGEDNGYHYTFKILERN